MLSGAEWNAIIGAGGLIMTIGLSSVIFYGFDAFGYPKKWLKELNEHYVPKLLRKKKEESPDAK